MSTDHVPIRRDACPLCGAANDCRFDAGPGRCWCTSERADAELVRWVRARGLEAACLCPVCLGPVSKGPRLRRPLPSLRAACTRIWLLTVDRPRLRARFARPSALASASAASRRGLSKQSLVGGVRSPCTDVCALDPEGVTCTGCGRTSAEIAAWPAMTPIERAAVHLRLRDVRG
ncbi:MAG: cysteine-rich CWC family protein [Planctomycetes bacterium]|nr:cysteine-rich CWC family protein [Planctomycetota bacterium]